VTATRVIRYRTRPECADDNARLIGAVFDELAEGDVARIRYTALRLEDGVTFVHVAMVDGDANPLDASPAFAAFQSGLGSRLEEGPFPATATVVGCHGGGIGG
jgi:hypothetical protein